MNLRDLKNLDKEEILNLLGLESKQSTSKWMLGTLGTFGMGLLVGAGVALMLAPKPGHELRGNIRERLRRAPEDLSDAVGSVVGRGESSPSNKTY
jgi:gas vesicle protein